MKSSPRVLCLLPVRQGAADLPHYLESVGRFADGIVALDDGSTDRSREILASSPLVLDLLVNPPRPSAMGWHDGRNRARLLRAAEAFGPEWIVFLDADERIPADDAEALRGFLETDALPGCAYGLMHFRMWGGDRHDPRGGFVYRLFAFEPGLELPDAPLHFNPVPSSIPREAWLPTTIRVQHFGAGSAERVALRLAKYREADPAGIHRTDFGFLGEHPDPDWPPWPSRDPRWPILLPADESGLPDVLPGPAGHDGPLLACLVPARNCASDLPGFLESAARVADVIVALDDGSTDRSAEILESHPAVARLIRRPLRAGYAGWDDALNRRLLLEAADELKPRWILFLDADERIPADDAVALREFLQGEAAAGYAYCFRVYRTTEDLGSWDRAGLWVARLFAWEPGLRLPEERLHLVPVPQSIPRESFVRTTVRIQHLGGATEERRRDRLEKYREADPFGDHSAASASVRGLRPWTPRPSDLPVVMSGDPLDVSLTGVSPAAQTAEALEAPAVSVIVISRDDEDRIERAVRSVVEQQCPEPFEVIVVTSGRGRTASIVRETFPEVTVVELERPALPGQARNAGLAVAGGDYVSFPGSHVVVLPGSLAARLRAHRLGYGMVTGRMRNGTTTPAGWASYFLDHSSVLPGTPSGELAGPPAHCSYDRELLLEVGGFPSRMRAGEDTMVNIRLARRGVVAYGASDVELVHQSPCSTPLRLALHHFRRGRAHGRILLHDAPSRRMLGQGSGPGRIGLSYVERRMETIRGQVERDGGEGLRAVHRRVEPLIRMAAASAWAGIWCELLRPEAGKASVVAAEVIGPRLRRLVGGTTSR